MTSPSPTFCGQCGAPLAEGAKFCGTCGSEARAQTAAAASPPIARKQGGPILLIAAAVAIVGLAALAMLLGGSGESGGAEAFLALAPAEARDFLFIDLDMTRGEQEFREILENVDALHEFDEQFGLGARELSRIAILTIEGERHVVVSAREGETAITSALRLDDFEEDAGSVWYGGGWYEATADLGGGRYAFTYYDYLIDEFIDTRDGARSFSEREDVRQVFDRVTADQEALFFVFLTVECPFLDGCRTLALSVGDPQDGEVSGVYAFNFRSELDAEDALSDVEELFGLAETDEVSRDGALVVAGYRADAEAFLGVAVTLLYR